MVKQSNRLNGIKMIYFISGRFSIFNFLLIWGQKYCYARFDFGAQTAPGAAVLPEAILYQIKNQPKLSYYERSPCIYENQH